MYCFPATTVPVERGPGADTGLWFPDTHHHGEHKHNRGGESKANSGSDSSGSVCCGRREDWAEVDTKDGHLDSEKIISGGQCLELG